MNWESIKHSARIGLLMAVKFFMLENLAMYLFASLSAWRLVGLREFVGFLAYCWHWPQR